MNKYDPNIHHRKSIRLKGYDYSQAGLYFITICCYNHHCLFGEIVSGNIEPTQMILNTAGKIADECWLAIPSHFPDAVLHEYVIMPNHIHGIIELSGTYVGANKYSPNPPNNDTNENVGANKYSPDSPDSEIGIHPEIETENHSPSANGSPQRANIYSPLRSPSKTIGSIIRGFKIGVTKWFRQNTNIYTVWQRDYWEHIIRDEQSYQHISHYITNNPANWLDDKFYKIGAGE